jgi:anti-sigma regulatory factor (Ser/Thr protein kinase)
MGADAAATPPPRGETRRGMFSRVGADVAAGFRTSSPTLRRAATRFGDWLAGIGWGKFFLLSILALVFGGILSSSLFDRGPTIVVEKGGPAERVDVQVSVTPEGIRIAPPTPPKPPRPPRAATPPDAPAPPDAAPEPDAAPPAGTTPAERGRAGVSVNERGVRIFANRDGKRVAIVIDDRGVHVEDADAAAKRGVRVDGTTIVIPPEVASDPEKVAEAIESVRDTVEDIVSEQVSRQVARRARMYSQQSEDWLMSLVFLLIVAMIIIKLVLGSKKKAESRAQVATATAAEEGLKRQLAEAQLKMMQAQVEPHFLFNTLASVDYLIETDPARASRMQKNLIQYLRAALPQMREGSTTLGKEVALCRSYLEILKVRMEDRLQFVITVPQGLSSAQFPPMMLQSLVENCIKHGLEPKAEGGSLTISADFANGNLRVTVADTGLGFAAGTSSGSGVGLANVRERLAALYGGRAQLIIAANTPTGTIATIEVPYTFDTAASAQQPPQPPFAAQPA